MLNEFAGRSLAHLLIDSMRGLDDLWSNPGQGSALRCDSRDICVALLLGQAEIGNLTDEALVTVSQEKIGTLEVKVHNPLGMQVFHSLQKPPSLSETIWLGLWHTCIVVLHLLGKITQMAKFTTRHNV